MPPLSLIQSVLSLVAGAQVSSGSFGIVSLYLSASLRGTAALKAAAQRLLCLFLCVPAASFLYLLYSLYPIVTSHPSIQHT